MADHEKRDTPSREGLLHLLAEAAELEHNLLCAYLYACFSLKRPQDLQPDPAGADCVRRWRAALMSVCMEEMGHLAQVANLTVALGARPHFNRPNFPVAPGYHPASVQIALQGFSLESLQHFIYLERSQHDPVADCPPIATEAVERPATPPGALMPSAPDYQTIGEFYGTLRRQLDALSERCADRLFAQAQSTQLRPEEIGVPGLVVVTDLRSAHRAIDLIVIQGEGSAQGEPDDGSHFARFTDMRQELQERLARDPGFEPAYPVARNPVMRKPLSEDRVHVDAAPAAQLLDATNAAYALMLRALATVYDLPWGQQTERQAALDTALWSMKQLGALSEQLVKLPAQAGHPSVHAGPTFTMLRATEGWATGTDMLALLAERRRQLEASLEDLQQQAGASPPGAQALSGSRSGNGP